MGTRRSPRAADDRVGLDAGDGGEDQGADLVVAGRHDKQVSPERVRELYADLGAREKVFVDLACSSHNAMWERNHTLLFRASLEWLTQGSVNGSKDGILKIGYGAGQ